MWQTRWRESSTTDSNIWRKPGNTCTEQAGFRKNRSCEDQILRLTHSISDRYKATMPRKTVPAILDCSKAFDRVWREDLLIRAIGKRTERPKCRTTPETPSRIRLVAAPIPIVHRRPSASHTRKRGGGHVCRRCFTLQQPSPLKQPYRKP